MGIRDPMEKSEEDSVVLYKGSFMQKQWDEENPMFLR